MTRPNIRMLRDAIPLMQIQRKQEESLGVIRRRSNEDQAHLEDVALWVTLGIVLTFCAVLLAL